ncbi:hypothetical protein TWF730_002640 [Orbilia blumenaviensis]|uniref:Nephrocystin 3-like N-terminal domain-containing protein n=1 Tax=Orbilia blumenaviensis TaxID=1796055 RepID=A0AAV9UAG8_9PEZI
MKWERADYTVGWICALPIEKAAAIAVLDEKHEGLPAIAGEEDSNTYTLGRVGHHNVVIACLPAGNYGTNSAATVATHLRRSFPSVKFGLMVGIGGGIPNDENDVRLGDIVVSQPLHGTGGVVQYDFGKRVGEDALNRTGYLNGPPAILLNASASLQAEKSRFDLGSSITAIAAEAEGKDERFAYPNSEDHLYRADYAHIEGKGRQKSTCASCDPSFRIDREEREYDNPIVHYGVIASGNQVIKNAIIRDKIGEDTKAICFEMEAAGLMNQSPCLVIRGICDYSDSHKNKSWQPYAAITAAAYAKELLNHVPLPSNNGFEKSISRPDVSKGLHALSSISRDPEIEKTGIERRKDKLINGSYQWIKESQPFQEWFTTKTQILSLVGGPGKGKTMIMIGIINELESNCRREPPREDGDEHPKYTNLALPSSTQLSYFLCQGTNEHLNSAISVLKGLLLYLARKNEKLAIHLQRRYDSIGEAFGDMVDLNLLQLILFDILDDLSGPSLLFCVDALDECVEGRTELLAFIRRSVEHSMRVKWLISSRPHQDIRSCFASRDSCAEIVLEENQDSVNAAIETYIDSKVADLHYQKAYRLQDKQEIEYVLKEKCGGTFLWVHLACKELELSHALSCEAVSILQEIPQELTNVYARMVEQIKGLDTKTSSRCFDILATAVVVYRPLALGEIGLLSIGVDHLPDVERLAKLCGSFLSVENGAVFFIHQSAKDYLVSARSDLFDKEGLAVGHKAVFRSSLRILTDPRYLKKDIAGLGWPGTPREKIEPAQRALVGNLLYMCSHWARHLECFTAGVPETNTIMKFLKNNFFYWLEALSVSGKLADALLQLDMVQSISVKWDHSKLRETVLDAYEFLKENFSVIEALPLQIYSAALIFTPQQSLTRIVNMSKLSKWLDPGTLVSVRETWDPHQGRVLHSSQRFINSIIYSADGMLIAASCSVFSSDSNSRTTFIRVWDALTGLCRYSFPTSDYYCQSFFSPDNSLVATFTNFGDIIAWDVTTGRKATLLNTGLRSIKNAVFSADWKTLGLSAWNERSQHRETQLWDIAAKKRLLVVKGGSLFADGLMFTPNNKLIIFGFDNDSGSMLLWDAEARTEFIYGPDTQLHGNINSGWHCMSAAVSPNGRLIACHLQGVQVLDLSANKMHDILTNEEDPRLDTRSVSFSPDGKLLMATESDGDLHVWNTSTWQYTYRLKRSVHVAAFSPTDPNLIVAGSKDGTARILSLIPENPSQPNLIERHLAKVQKVVLSPDSRLAASLAGLRYCNGLWYSGGESNPRGKAEVRIWDTSTGVCLHSLGAPHGLAILDINFNPGDNSLLSCYINGQIVSWDPETGQHNRTFNTPSNAYACFKDQNSISISQDGSMFAVCGSNPSTVWLWSAIAGGHLHTFPRKHFEGESYEERPVMEFSPDGKYIAIGHWDSGSGYFELRETISGRSLGFFAEHSYEVTAVKFSPQGNLIASASEDGDIQFFDLRGLPWNETKDESTRYTCISRITHRLYLEDQYSETDDYYSNVLISTRRGRIPRPHLSPIEHCLTVAFSPNGKTLVIAGYDGEIQLCDVTSGKCFRVQQFRQNNRYQDPSRQRKYNRAEIEFSDDINFFIWGYATITRIVVPTSFTWLDGGGPPEKPVREFENSIFLDSYGLYVHGKKLLDIPPVYTPEAFDFKDAGDRKLVSVRFARTMTQVMSYRSLDLVTKLYLTTKAETG